MINDPVTAEKILEIVKTIKNNKSPGSNTVVNEYIKSSINTMIPLYVKLFNLVFDIGIIPEAWLVENIKLIHKKKSSYANQQNHCPITLWSCLVKVFTSVLCRILTTFAIMLILSGKIRVVLGKIILQLTIYLFFTP